MPNWIENELTVDGPKEDILIFLKRCGYQKSLTFSFNSLMPIPEELMDIHTSYGEGEEWYYRLKGEKKIRISLDERIHIYDTHGAIDTLSWCMKYWGVKFDACCVTSTVEDVNFSSCDYCTIKFYMETAWGPPQEIYDYLVKTFPNLSIDWFYKDNSMRSAGWLEV